VANIVSGRQADRQHIGRRAPAQPLLAKGGQRQIHRQRIEIARGAEGAGIARLARRQRADGRIAADGDRARMGGALGGQFDLGGLVDRCLGAR
jgi:hypothetical protein